MQMTNELPKWRCHKIVSAVKITAIHSHDEPFKCVILHDEDCGPIIVADSFIIKTGAKVGGYYVVYKDGYNSYSPAEAFEEGYTRV